VKVTVLSESDIRQVVALDQSTLDAVGNAFAALSAGRAVSPVMSIPVAEHHGEMHVKSAVIQGFDGFAVKIASGFFDNPTLGLPSGSGMMLLFSAITGFPMAVLLDNGYLTHTRTAAAGAIVAKFFAPGTVRTAGIIGAGRQGAWQLRALALARPFARALVFDRDPARAEAFAAEMSPALGVPVSTASAEQVVRESECVVTATPSVAPIIRAEWLHPGLHITAMGADNGHKQELYPEVLAAADRRICDLRAQVFRLGEHKFALDAGALAAAASVDEIGDVLLGRAQPRENDAQITVADLTGTGAQDTAIALLAFARAQESRLGLVVGD
jgi:ornithine cyclodeaminase